MYHNMASVLYFGVLGGAYGTLLSLPRIKPAPPELEGESLGTGPPGESWNPPFLDKEAQQTDHWIKEALSQLVGGGWGNLSHSTFSDGPWKWDASVDTIKSFLGQTFRPRVKTMEGKMSSLHKKPNNTIKKLAQWTRSGPSEPAIYRCKPEHPIRALKKCSLVRLPAVNKIIPKENKWAHTGRVPTVVAGISPHGQEMLALSCRLCSTGDLLQLGSNVPPWEFTPGVIEILYLPCFPSTRCQGEGVWGRGALGDGWLFTQHRTDHHEKWDQCHHPWEMTSAWEKWLKAEITIALHH